METAAGENSRRDFLENRFTFLFLSKRSLYKSNGSVPKKIFRKSGVEITKSSNLGIFKTAIKLREKEGIEIATIKEWLIKTEVEDAYDGEGTHGNY